MPLKLKCNSCDGIYSNSVDIRFTKACDNNCGFCIEKNGIGEQGTDVEALIASTIASGKKEVLILGGEPFLYPDKLLRYVTGIRDSVDKIYITTSVPKMITSKTSYSVIELIDGLNVSTNHYNSARNNKIFNASSRHNRHNILEKLCKSFSDKIRVSINLVKGEIDTMWELELFYTTMKRIGVKHIKVNELQNCPELYVSFERIFFKKMKSPFASGCQTEMMLLGIKTTLKRSCFIVEPTKHASILDFIKISLIKIIGRKKEPCAVIYENGLQTEGWQTPKRSTKRTY